MVIVKGDFAGVIVVSYFYSIKFINICNMLVPAQ